MHYKFPTRPELLRDIRAAAETFILPDYTPEFPILPKSASVVTAGSCFADNIAATLLGLGMETHTISIVEGLNSPLATLDMIRRLSDGDDGGIAGHARLARASLLVLTVGVAIHPFLHGHPIFAFGRENVRGLHWRMLTVEEIKEAIMMILDEVRLISPSLKTVISISPIPLQWSKEHRSVFGQDCLSKSLIRVAVESVLSEKIKDVYYWPSFEIVRWLGGHSGPFFGTNGQDARHIDQNVLDIIMSLFIRRYFY